MIVSYSAAISQCLFLTTLVFIGSHMIFSVFCPFYEDVFNMEEFLSFSMAFASATISVHGVGSYFREIEKIENSEGAFQLPSSRSSIWFAVMAVVGFFAENFWLNFYSTLFSQTEDWHFILTFLPPIIFSLSTCFFINEWLAPRLAKWTFTSVLGNVLGVLTLFVFGIFQIPFVIYNQTIAKCFRLSKVKRSLRDKSVIENATAGSFFVLTSFIMGSVFYPMVMQHLEKVQNTKDWQIVLVILKCVNIFTAVFGFHQSFNTMIVTVALLTNVDLPQKFANILVTMTIIFSFQLASAVAQAFVGRTFPSLSLLFIKTENDAKISHVVREKFEEMVKASWTRVLWIAAKLGYFMNASGDSVYSLEWGCKAAEVKMSWGRMTCTAMAKEIFLSPSSFVAVLCAYFVTSEPKVIYKIFVFLLLVILFTNQTLSTYLMAKEVKKCSTFVKKSVKNDEGLFWSMKMTVGCVNLLYMLGVLVTFLWFKNIVEVWNYLALSATFLNVWITGTFFCELVEKSKTL